MSQEEFDNRLRSSFSDEFVPPKEHLWVNISEKLEQKSRKPLWYWLLPVLIAIGVSLAWLSSGLFNAKDHIQSVNENSQQTAPANSNSEPSASHKNNESESPIQNQASISNKSDIKEIETEINAKKPANQPVIAAVHSTDKKPKKSNVTQVPVAHPRKTNERELIDAWRDGAGKNERNRNNLFNAASRIPTRSFEEALRFFQLADFPYFPLEISSEPESSIALLIPEEEPSKTNKPKPEKTTGLANLESKKWFSFGIGPSIAQNSLKISDDSQAYVNHFLWDNKDMVTHNGIGINSFISYHYKFGKKNRFSIESGLNYSFRTEDIKFNESTIDIAVRDRNNKINSYINLIIWYVDPFTGDTTFYNAVQSFTMIKKNKYNVLTVPLRFNSEHKISDNTFLSLGLGAGFSMISAKNISHFNLIHEKEETQRKMTHFSASFNTLLSLYTKFNEMGQVGIYTGFQSYLQPWKVNSGQYKIQMSDIQFGLTFRRPLN